MSLILRDEFRDTPSVLYPFCALWVRMSFGKRYSASRKRDFGIIPKHEIIRLSCEEEVPDEMRARLIPAIASRMDAAMVHKIDRPFFELIHFTIKNHLRARIGVNREMETWTDANVALVRAHDCMLLVGRKSGIVPEHIDAEVHRVRESSDEACEHRIQVGLVKVLAEARQVVVTGEIVVTTRGIEQAILRYVPGRPRPVGNMMRIANVRRMPRGAKPLHICLETTKEIWL